MTASNDQIALRIAAAFIISVGLIGLWRVYHRNDWSIHQCIMYMEESSVYAGPDQTIVIELPPEAIAHVFSDIQIQGSCGELYLVVLKGKQGTLKIQVSLMPFWKRMGLNWQGV